MRCPYCHYDDSKVIDSRDVGDGVRRRRECLRCGRRFTTQEHIETVALFIIKKDGRREEFNRTKLTTGIRKACEKRPLPTGAIEKLVDDIESHLMSMGMAEVASPYVGEMVMERLRNLDQIAYIRFASVYRQFTDIQDVRREVEALETRTAPLPSAQLPLIPSERLAPAVVARKRLKPRRYKARPKVRSGG